MRQPEKKKEGKKKEERRKEDKKTQMSLGKSRSECKGVLGIGIFSKHNKTCLQQVSKPVEQAPLIYQISREIIFRTKEQWSKGRIDSKYFVSCLTEYKTEAL